MQLKLNNQIKVTKFAADTYFATNTLKDMKNLVEECDDLYPGIDMWFKRKVEPGFLNKERVGLLVYEGEKPVGVAILKNGQNAKLCSLRILPESRSNGLGDLLMILSAIEIRTHSQKMHFTISEQTWAKYSSFFETYGFICNGPSEEQYRLFEQELSCSADFSSVWQSVLKKLPHTIENLTINGNSKNWDIVMSVKPSYVSRILSNDKKVEIRKHFSQKWKGARVLLYSSAPEHQFVGEAEISEIITESPLKVWEEWKSELGCTYDEFSNYCNGTDKISAIIFCDVRSFRSPIYKSQLEHLIKRNLQPPQSFCSVKSNEVWAPALSLTCLLQSEL